MASARIKHTTDAQFDADVLKSQAPVLLDMWAKWCGPCLQLAPFLDVLADEFGDQLQIVKLDIDSNPQVPAKFGVTSIPTLLLFKGGSVADQMVGNPGSANRLRDFVKKNL